jgi:oligoribonuclease NrnB/cAMP/cGMP phosphodiesterase (DHH superfamily)
VVPRFCSHAKIDETLLGLRCEPAEAEHEIWITDISWTDPAVDRHLQWLIDRGARVYWIDHHRTALERHRRGAVTVRLTESVLSEACAASRLTYDYLCRCLREEGATNQWLAQLEPLVALADDNDRWLHRIAGSRELALTVSAMQGLAAYHDLLDIDAAITYTPRMLEARAQVEAELRRSFEVAEGSRVVRHFGGRAMHVVAAVCDGYPSEVADAWGRTSPNTIFALFDAKSLTVSLRRSPECVVDLSQVARQLGGGGHPAAAGCALPELHLKVADLLAESVAGAIDRLEKTRDPEA